MSYEFAPQETIPHGVIRIAGEQLDRVVAHLTHGRATPAERVHETRKRFKEMRALLRLARFALGRDFAFENAWYRDAGRSLAAARDAEAMIEAVRKLRAASSDDEETALLTAAKEALGGHPRADLAGGAEAMTTTLMRDLRLCRARITTWPAIVDDFRALRPGLQRTYRDGRRAMRDAIGDPAPERFHAWRKRAKDHWYHTQLLRNISSEMRGRMAALQQLSRDLGDHHDLALLEDGIISGRLLAPVDRRVTECVIRAARRHRELLERSAIAAGSMLYAEKPSRLAARIQEAWRTAADAARSAVE